MRKSAGIAPSSSPSKNARSSPVEVVSPIGAQASSQRAQTAATSGTSSGRTTATMRSWLSEIMISHGSMPASRSGTRSRWTSIPEPPRAISASDDASPAAPQSCSDSTRPRSTSSRLTSASFLPVNGSPIWTVGRLSASSSPSSALASTLAPPMPSRPVVAPKRTTALPARPPAAVCTRSAGSRPTHIAFTRQLSRYAGSKVVVPPTVGMPIELP